MRCPFMKITEKVGVLCDSFRETGEKTISVEEFNKCIKYECMAYDDKKGSCKLCEK